MLRIRPVRDADLDAVYDIYYEDSVADHGTGERPPRAEFPAFLRHEIATGTFRVAEEDERVVGYGASVTRDGIAFLAELFVAQDAQSRGAGKALFDAVMPAELSWFTYSSTDPRALGLYARAGMPPRRPDFWLSTARRVDLPPTDVAVAVADPDDPALAEWDARVSGRHRPEDHTYWLRELAAVPLWFQRGGETVGYGWVQERIPGSLWDEEQTTVGPVGAAEAAHAAACTTEALRWAAARRPTARLLVPGTHPALPALLDAGLRIGYVETFCGHADLADPTCYIPSGAELF